jgi:hypothetical protein
VRLAPLDRLEPKLEGIYSTLKEGKEGLQPPKLPQDYGYPKSDAPYEIVAEFLRAYLTDPNYVKTVAPDAAAVARAMVNSHPELSRARAFIPRLGCPRMGRETGHELLLDKIGKEEPDEFPWPQRNPEREEAEPNDELAHWRDLDEPHKRSFRYEHSQIEALRKPCGQAPPE